MGRLVNEERAAPREGWRMKKEPQERKVGWMRKEQHKREDCWMGKKEQEGKVGG